MNYNKREFHIAVDLDDTLCNTAKVIREEAKNFHMYKLNRKVKKMKVVNCSDYFYFAHELQWNKEDVTLFFKECYPNYLKRVKPLKFVKRAIDLLVDKGYIVHIISARPFSEVEDVRKLTEAWLMCYKIQFHTLDLGYKNKSDLVKKYNCNVFIDDSVDNCEEVLSKIPDIKVILFETKYNYNCDSDIDHANDWKKLAKELIEYRETIYE